MDSYALDKHNDIATKPILLPEQIREQVAIQGLRGMEQGVKAQILQGSKMNGGKVVARSVSRENVLEQVVFLSFPSELSGLPVREDFSLYYSRRGYC
jgi:hypothetical protein